MCHRRTWWSAPPDASVRPSGLKANARTPSLCLWRMRSTEPSLELRMRTLPSIWDEANRSPSGESARFKKTGRSVLLQSGRPVPASQAWRTPRPSPAKRRNPSGDWARQESSASPVSCARNRSVPSALFKPIKACESPAVRTTPPSGENRVRRMGDCDSRLTHSSALVTRSHR